MSLECAAYLCPSLLKDEVTMDTGHPKADCLNCVFAEKAKIPNLPATILNLLNENILQHVNFPHGKVEKCQVSLNSSNSGPDSTSAQYYPKTVHLLSTPLSLL